MDFLEAITIYNSIFFLFPAKFVGNVVGVPLFLTNQMVLAK